MEEHEPESLAQSTIKSFAFDLNARMRSYVTLKSHKSSIHSNLKEEESEKVG